MQPAFIYFCLTLFLVLSCHHKVKKFLDTTLPPYLYLPGIKPKSSGTVTECSATWALQSFHFSVEICFSMLIDFGLATCSEAQARNRINSVGEATINLRKFEFRLFRKIRRKKTIWPKKWKSKLESEWKDELLLEQYLRKKTSFRLNGQCQRELLVAKAASHWPKI